jgi:hypothetical protein
MGILSSQRPLRSSESEECDGVLRVALGCLQLHAAKHPCPFYTESICWEFITIPFTSNNNNNIIISQEDINAFVDSAFNDTLTPAGVATAVGTRGIPVNGHSSTCGSTALHWAVRLRRREVVVALLAAGADANANDKYAATSVLWGAAYSTADIVQLLIDGGGSVNEPDKFGDTPLIALVMDNVGDAAARLQVLFLCPDLDLDATSDGKTAEEWAVDRGCSQLACAIADERRQRMRWSALRASWIAATVAPTTAPSIVRYVFM